MRRLALCLAVLFVASTASAQAVVTCSVTGLTPAQTTTLGEMVAAKNAAGGDGTPFADWPAYCSWRMRSDFIGYVQWREAERLRAIGLAVTTHGNETATTVQCTAAGVAAGCKKSEVACWVLTGSPVCN